VYIRWNCLAIKARRLLPSGKTLDTKGAIGMDRWRATGAAAVFVGVVLLVVVFAATPHAS
jgi:hypothetical protein